MKNVRLYPISEILIFTMWGTYKWFSSFFFRKFSKWLLKFVQIFSCSSCMPKQDYLKIHDALKYVNHLLLFQFKLHKQGSLKTCTYSISISLTIYKPHHLIQITLKIWNTPYKKFFKSRLTIIDTEEFMSQHI